MDAGTPANGSGGTGKQLARVPCPQCGQVLEFSGPRPSFCGFCGKPLPGILDESTIVPQTGSEAPTVAPYIPAVPSVDRQPDVVGGYRLLRRIGGGGMGTVYEAEDPGGRRVALKLIAGNQAASDDTLERFRREGRLASAISHPRCVFVLAADEDAGRPYIVMELMPGETLADVLRRRGRMPPAEAVAAILDVLDGLREAHRLGVVHRDIKPSNCFIDSDGRVKIGDFGLSKSLVGEARLTQSGSFLGTPLFASPEQVRGEALGPQSDVYSLAATLYSLLTGKAPFEGGDAAATLARIAADPVPSLRASYPEISPALDRVVLRGLERDRRRRWRDLDEFKEALLPFVPGRQDPAGRSVRFAAFLVDLVFLYVAGIVWALFAFAIGIASFDIDQDVVQRQAVLQIVVRTILWSIYFIIPERLWGCTPGKWLLNLRVNVSPGREIPSWRRTIVRFAVFYLLCNLEQIFVIPWLGTIDLKTDANKYQMTDLMLLQRPFQLVGAAILLSTMRRRNGWRGLHEFASGTCVVQLPELVHRHVRAIADPGESLPPSQGMPDRVGPFEVRGIFHQDENVRVLAGEDRALGRRVLLWLRPADASPLSPARRNCARATRLRWLASGQHENWQWDAFAAPAGSLLSDIVRTEGRLRWLEARLILEQLTDELAAATADGTLGGALSVDQVWLQPDGCVLLDVPLRATAAPKPTGDKKPAELTFLAEVATVALAGSLASRTGHIAAIMPEHASRLLDRLLDGKKAFHSLAEFQAELESTRNLPKEVNRGRRVAHLLVQTWLLSIGLVTVVLVGWLSGLPPLLVLAETRKEGQEALKKFETGAAGEFSGNILSSEPLIRAAAAYCAVVDGQTADQIRDNLAIEERILDARSRSVDRVNLAIFHWLEELIDRQMTVTLPPARARIQRDPGPERDFRSGADHWLGEAHRLPEREWTDGEALAFVLALWPAIWVGSAFLFRGGISFLLMGLSLVQTNGYRAGRFRCAARAVLVWLPPTAILAGAILLENWYWSTRGAASGGRWIPVLVELLRFAGIGLFALYPVLAVRSPEQGLHDRLTGTRLVPR